MIARDRDKLIAALLEVPSFQDTNLRNDIVKNLPGHIQARISRQSTLFGDTQGIIETCAIYRDGLRTFLDILRSFEDGSIPFLKVEEIIEDILSGVEFGGFDIASARFFPQSKGITWHQKIDQINRIIRKYHEQNGSEREEIFRLEERGKDPDPEEISFKFANSRLQQLKCNRDDVKTEFLAYFAEHAAARPVHFFVLQSESCQKPLSFTERVFLELQMELKKSVYYPREGENNKNGASLKIFDFPNGRGIKYSQIKVKNIFAECLGGDLQHCQHLEEILNREKCLWRRKDDYLAITMKIRSVHWRGETYQFCNWFLDKFCSVQQEIHPQVIFFLYIQIEEKAQNLPPWKRLFSSSGSSLIPKHLKALRDKHPWIYVFDKPLETPKLSDLKEWLRDLIKIDMYRRQIVNTLLAGTPEELYQAQILEDYAREDSLTLDMSVIESFIHTIIKALQPQIRGKHYESTY